MIEYTLIASSKNNELSNSVNKLLKEGWKLYGTPFLAKYSFAQALTKELQTKNPIPAEQDTGGISNDRR
jgi:hypothetical protein